MRLLSFYALTSCGLAMLLAGCGSNELPPAGQLRVHVATDAPTPGNAEAAALFDRVEMAVVTREAKSACEDCTRTLVLSQSALEQGVSFGIVPLPGRSDLVLRSRLFLSRHGLVDGDGDGVVETWTRMPTVGEDGIVDMTVKLSVSDLGVPVGSAAAPVEPTLGLPDPSFIGSFAGAKPQPCASASPRGAVCVPGGASWMGDPVYRDLASTRQGWMRRIVVVRPFHLDETEVTVGAFRKSGLAQALEPVRTSTEQFCTYSDASSPDVDALALNCISPERALEFCKARGGTLPTEAQLAYVQGGLKGTRYLWGDDDPTCEDVVFARIPTEYSGSYPDECVYLSKRAGVQPVGQGLRDRLSLEGGTIVDLAGNLSELALDDFEPDGGSCWPRGVLVDPLCVADGGGPVAHGGSVYSSTVDLRAGLRGSLAGAASPFGLQLFLPQLGFRCAYDD